MVRLTDETKQLKYALELSFKSKDATACATICKKKKDMIPHSVLNTMALFKEGRQNSGTFIYWDTFLESGNILLLLLRVDEEENFPCTFKL